ncbi:MAG: GNAT family N-acetyltransferase [Acidimicrobiales bacterium]
MWRDPTGRKAALTRLLRSVDVKAVDLSLGQDAGVLIGPVGKNEVVIDHFDPLQTSRLRLEPITAEVARLIASGEVSGLGVADGWPQAGTRNGVALAMEHGHPAGWLVRCSGLVIGDCGIHAPVDDAGCVEIGYGLADPYRAQGFGTELVQAISDWLLAQGLVSAVRARTDRSNAASRRVLEKAGFIVVDAREEETVYERRL